MACNRRHKYTIHFKYQKWTSIPDSKGSVTVEAAISIPIFLFAVLCLVYLLEIQAIRTSIHSAVQSAAKNAAEDIVIIPVLNLFKFRSDIVNFIGSDRLDRSIIDGGSSGISCLTSWYQPDTGEIHVNVSYKVRLPFPGFLNPGVRQKEQFVVKAWTGYEKSQMEGEDGRIVYVTDEGSVYHTNYQCTYLQLSVRFVPSSGLTSLRNLSGGKYYACEKCTHGSVMAGVYITDNGGKYHNSLNCGGLRRSIRAVKKTDISGMGSCSRCSN